MHRKLPMFMLAVAVFFGGACNSTESKKEEASKPTASGVPSATISASNLSQFVPSTGVVVNGLNGVPALTV